MSGRMLRLFRRYGARHLTLDSVGPALTGPDGQSCGKVTRLALIADRLVVEGQLAAGMTRIPQITLRLGDRQRSTTPEAHLAGPAIFRLDLPWRDEAAALAFDTPAGAGRVMLPVFARWRLGLARMALVPGFLWRMMRAVPPVLRWYRFRDPVARIEVREILGLRPTETGRPLGPAILEPLLMPVLAPSSSPVTLILPVYQAGADLSLLVACLDRVARHSDLSWHMVAINDASPEAGAAVVLADFAARHPGQVTLLENPRNLGFIGTVNRGLVLAAARPGPVILLNTDALVPAGWLSRLVAPILADPERVASVTPLSNDAELGCVPVICARHDLRPGEGDAIDVAAQSLGPVLVAGPTGVGFCMALNPLFLAMEPALDPAFGRGYGEEVDWCQKVARRGGKHLYHGGIFVEHRGGSSFGPEEKRRLLQRSGAEIARRYPRFDNEVQQFLAEDPLLTARLALGLGFAAARAGVLPVPVYLGHAMGGGAEHWLAAQLARDVAGQGAAVVLRVGGPRRWRIELHSAEGITWGDTGDRELVCKLLMRLPRRRIIYSCGVGDPDPLQLPDLLLRLAEGAAQQLEVLFHDYFPISPAYTLLGSDGQWHGPPDPATTDRMHRMRRPDGTRTPLAAWQAAWGRLVLRADRLVAFSGDSRALVLSVWPEVAARMVVQPHDIGQVPRLRHPGRGQRPVIGVLGNIGAHKGALQVVALSRLLARCPEAGLVILGELDPGFALTRPARAHGRYDLDELPDLVRRYGITCWLIPSIWPETFSFTTREALATGLPVWCFDLGAQAEAVRAAIEAGAQGGVIALPQAEVGVGAAMAQVLARILEPIKEG